MSTNSAFIGGLPAEKFLHRRVKFWDKEGKRHATPAVLYAVEGGKCRLKPDGHKEANVVVPHAKVSPWWMNNPDLKKERDTLLAEAANPPTMKGEQIVATEQPESIVSEPKDTPKDPQPERSVPCPNLIISDHSQDWIPAYKEYASLLASEKADTDLLAELEKSLAANRAKQRNILNVLKGMGVEVRYPQAQVAEEVKPTPAAPSRRKGGGRPRGEAPALVDKWCEQAAWKVATGRRVAGTLTGFAKEAGVHPATFQTHASKYLPKHKVKCVSEKDGSAGLVAGEPLKILRA